MSLRAVVGYFWVIEWTDDHRYHAHAVFWLDGNRTQITYPWAAKAGELWSNITDREGWHHRCEYKEHQQLAARSGGTVVQNNTVQQKPMLLRGKMR